MFREKLKLVLLRKEKIEILKKIIEDITNNESYPVKVLGFGLNELVKHQEFNKNDIDIFIFKYKDSLKDSFVSEGIINKIEEIENSIISLLYTIDEISKEIESELTDY